MSTERVMSPGCGNTLVQPVVRVKDHAKGEPGVVADTLLEVARGGLARDVDVLVAVDGVLVEHARSAADRDVRFLAWSMSKPLTAATVLALADQGVLHPDDPVSRWVPAFGQGGKASVTLADVLLHRGGFPDVVPGDPPLLRLPMSVFLDWPAAVEAMCRLTVLPEYAGRPCYHPMAYSILGAVVAAAAGAPFATVCQELLLAPLGMISTTWGLPTGTEAALPPLDPGTLEVCRSAVVPAGNAWTTAQDMARFYAMLAAAGRGEHGRVLTPAAVAGMTSSLTGEGPGGGFGHGTLVDTGPGRVFARGTRGTGQAYGHSGATATQSWHDPGNGVTLVALTDSACSQPESDARFDRLCDLVNDRYGRAR